VRLQSAHLYQRPRHTGEEGAEALSPRPRRAGACRGHNSSRAAAGLNLTPAEVDLLFAMREYTLTYNEYAGQLPGWVTGPFADEKVNLRVASRTV